MKALHLCRLFGGTLRPLPEVSHLESSSTKQSQALEASSNTHVLSVSNYATEPSAEALREKAKETLPEPIKMAVQKYIYDCLQGG